MSGQHLKEISLEAMVQECPFIAEAIFLRADAKNVLRKHFKISKILHGEKEDGGSIGKEIIVNRAGAWEWSLTMNRAEQTGERSWTYVKAYKSKTETKLQSGISYFVFLTPTVSRQFDFFAENGYLPLSAFGELEKLLKKKKR